MKNNYLEKSLKRFLKRKVKVTLGLVISFLITGTVSFGINFSNIKNEDQIFGMGDQKEFVIDKDFTINDTAAVTIEYDDKTIINGGGGIIAVNGAVVKNYAVIERYNGTSPLGAVNIIDSEFYNYGRVIGINIVNSKIYNYGSVSTGENKKGRWNPIYFSSDNNLLENYGYLSGENYTLDFTNKKNNEVHNYGTIQVYGGPGNGVQIFYNSPDKNDVYNYGVGIAKWSLAANVKGLNIENYGIFISGVENQNYTDLFGSVINKGVFLYREADTDGKVITYSLNKNGGINDNVTEISSNETIDNNKLKTSDSFFINNTSVKLDKDITEISNKVITAVSHTKDNIVLDNSSIGGTTGTKPLTLNNTSIVGYFEENGTLLKVDGDLTLKNGSIINAVAARDEDGNILADAVAVDVTGKLTYTVGESNIYGTIKGGEKSQITVKGEGNKTNDLNENLETSGEVNLLNGDWTKGLGKITLDGTDAVVNIDKGNGNLKGYLYGDNSDTKTTLDGMIEGNGTLNVNNIRFDMGKLEIGSLKDTYTVDGNGDVTLEGVSDIQGVLNKIDVSGIFNKDIQGSNIILTFKTAEEMGIHDPEKQKEYEELVKNFKDNKEYYDLINEGNAQNIREHLEILDKIMELMGTTGVKITRDLTGAFTNAVNEFDKKADKGEWLTSAKYINSDMEYDGTKTVNGYDSDINSMIGMAEYGITENTSVGFALGGGDTKIDLKHPEKKSTSFDGKNYYAGIYTKHSVNGFDMTGSLGYTVSDLDVDNGGSADSEAFTLAGYIKRDIKLSDTVKLQPNLSFIYDYIMQDTAEMGEGMTIDSGDYHVFEGGAGVNLVKEFIFEKGILKLETGIKYSMTNVERNQEITGKFYSADVNLGSPDIDDKKGTAHIGFDFENVKGFGVNAKYETMWSDSGDDNRITAGVSYRF